MILQAGLLIISSVISIAFIASLIDHIDKKQGVSEQFKGALDKGLEFQEFSYMLQAVIGCDGSTADRILKAQIQKLFKEIAEGRTIINQNGEIDL